MKQIKKVFCECCGADITGSPVYDVEGVGLCEPCFLEWVETELHLHPHWFAEQLGIAVREEETW